MSSRFSNYRPSRAMIEALRALRTVRKRLARAKQYETNTRQPVTRSDKRGGTAEPLGGGQDRRGGDCGGTEE